MTGTELCTPRKQKEMHVASQHSLRNSSYETGKNKRFIINDSPEKGENGRKHCSWLADIAENETRSDPDSDLNLVIRK